MKKEDTQSGSKIVKIIKSDEVIDLGKDYLEIGIDTALESGLLKDIPIVNSILGILSTTKSIRDQILTSKLLRFFSKLSEVPKEKRIAMADKLNSDDKFSGRVGTFVIEIIDKMESQQKPELAAKCFSAYATEEISFEEMRRLLIALERIPSFDIGKIEKFSKAEISELVTMDESMLLAFVNAGLGKNNGGFDGGAIVPTALCATFLKVYLS